jgi:plasmid stability protein
VPRQTTIIGASMPPDMAADLRARAAAADRTFSAELRQAIRHYLTATTTKMSPAAVATAPGSKIAGQGDHGSA